MPKQPDDLWLFGYGSLIWKPPPYYDLRVPGHIRGYVRRFWQASEDHRGTVSSPGRVVTLLEREYWRKLNDSHDGCQDISQDIPQDNLQDKPQDIIRGVAYRIPDHRVEEVKEYLDIREINGYSIQYTTFYPSKKENDLESIDDCDSAQTRTKTNDNDEDKDKDRDRDNDHKILSDVIQTLLALPQNVYNQPCIDNCLIYVGLPSNPQFLGSQTNEEIAEVIAHSKGPSGPNWEYLFMLDYAVRHLHCGSHGFQASHDSHDHHLSDLVNKVKRIRAMA